MVFRVFNSRSSRPFMARASAWPSSSRSPLISGSRARSAFGLPEIAFGLIPDVGGTTRMIRAAGEPRARELILTGRMLKARTAERYQLIHDVVPTVDELATRVTARAQQLASLSPAALAAAKTLCQASADTGGATSFRLEGVIQEALIAQPDLVTRFPAGLAFIKAQMAAAE